jgi:hypothetical protein
MVDHSKTFEISIAALGLVVAGLLGFGQWNLSRVQRLADESEQWTTTDGSA